MAVKISPTSGGLSLYTPSGPNDLDSSIVPIVINGITRKTFLSNLTSLCGGGTLNPDSVTGGTNIAVTKTQVSTNQSELTFSFVLPGIVVPYLMNGEPPSGWLYCNGEEVSKVTYSALYAVIQDQFGSSSNPANFVLPDLRGRIPFVASSSAASPLNGAQFASGNYQTVGSTGGSENTALTAAQAPIRSHTHTPVGTTTMTVYGQRNYCTFDGECSPPGSYGDFGILGSITGNGSSVSMSNSNVVSSAASWTSNSSQTSQPHSNTPPLIVLTYIIKT